MPEYGGKLLSAADSLAESVSTLTGEGADLAEAWSGDAAKEALRGMGVLRAAFIELAAVIGTVGEGVRWFGEDVLPAFKDMEQNQFVGSPFGGRKWGPGGYEFPVWDHEIGGNNCDCSIVFANPLAWTGVDTATCGREEHIYYYEYSGKELTYPRDAIPVAYREDLYSSELGRWVNERERQAIEDRKLDPTTIYLTAIARQHMNKLNDHLKALHAFMPEEVICDFPSYGQN
ncbi:WXG100 family type VII secretion target [Nonomuraea sp. 3N208]|uniref:WXG100 family type VII secretion target n=1 Tax=Nonomuraea sp. 3N208 TaxID=3457421 RepID=UPI003FCD2318